MPPILRSLPEWLRAGCPAVEVDAVHVVRLGARSNIATAKIPGDPGPIPDFLRRG